MDMTTKAEVTAIVEELKQKAEESRWEPYGVPPLEHYHVFPNGLSICFTLDILPGAQYWHLSISRTRGGLTREEVELWRRAFFSEEPFLVLPSEIIPGIHFYWKAPVRQESKER